MQDLSRACENTGIFKRRLGELKRSKDGESKVACQNYEKIGHLARERTLPKKANSNYCGAFVHNQNLILDSPHLYIIKT